MAKVIVTLKIMPTSPDVDLSKLEQEAKRFITEFAGEGETKSEQEPIAFGLKAIKIIFVMDEAQGSTEPLEEKVRALENVNSAEVVDVRRAVG